MNRDNEEGTNSALTVERIKHPALQHLRFSQLIPGYRMRKKLSTTGHVYIQLKIMSVLLYGNHAQKTEQWIKADPGQTA